MNSFHSLIPLVALAAPSLTPAVASNQESIQDEVPARERSVLFYLMDTTRRDRMGFGGYQRETTPFLDWLAERSVVFETCYSQGDWTKTSMAAMLSSQYPSTTGVYKMDHRLPESFVTWPEVLREHGMYTAGFSANIVMGNVLSNYAQGFDHFTESTLINQGDPIRFASGSARKLNAHVFPWLESNDHWPLLLYMHSVDPHEDYEPEASYLERFADPARHGRFRKEWKTLLKDRPPIPGLYVTQTNFDRTQIDSGSFIEHSSNLYDADISANDQELQRLWDKLQAEEWGEDFIFVFTSDHGEEFFDHGGTCHGYSLYEEMLRIPLMIYAPDLLPAGKRITTPVRSIDIYPTLCELLDFPAPQELEGQSLVALARGQDTWKVADVFSEHREDPIVRMLGQGSGVMVSVRRGKWKYIFNQVSSQMIEKPDQELYDLNTDPHEQKNLASAFPEVAAELDALVQAYIDKQWSGPALEDQAELDDEVLDELRALGYLGEEDEDDDTCDLWAAIGVQDLTLTKQCLSTGSDPNQLEPNLGLRPLSMAALMGDLELAKLLLKSGAKIDGRSQDGSTALSGAAFLGRAEVLAFLLDSGADTSIANHAGDTPLDATQVPIETTQFVARLLKIEFEKDTVVAGRLECAELLVPLE